MSEVKEAKRVISKEDIKFNESNKAMAIASCIPLVGLILFFVEKEDMYVRYMGMQFAMLGIVSAVLGVIPCLNLIVFIALVAAIVVGMVKASKGERLDLPVLSDFTLKLMN